MSNKLEPCLCNKCEGTGYIKSKVCTKCSGEGAIFPEIIPSEEDLYFLDEDFEEDDLD